MLCCIFKNKELSSKSKKSKHLKKDDFLINKKIYSNQGSYGKIHTCTWKKTNKQYIVKIINNNTSSQKEVQINSVFNNEYIGEFLGFFEDKKSLYLIFEKYEGGDLYDLINSHGTRLEENVAKYYVKQILTGLCYIHKCDIIHRDIKLSNILIDDKTNTIKIIDFGCSEYTTDKDENLVGSPGFFAPEILLGNYTTKCDIWSLGCIVFIFLFGFNPFNPSCKYKQDTIIKNIMKGFNSEIKESFGAFFPKSIPISRNAMDFITNILVLDPDSRMSAEECLQHPWFMN
jgi:calcium-dependent protein kinase